MIKVINPGLSAAEWPRLGDCPACLCLFEYDREDIRALGHLAGNWYAYEWQSYVRCPGCKVLIPVAVAPEGSW